MTPSTVTNYHARKRQRERLLFPYGSNALTPDQADIRRGFRHTRLAYLVAAIVVAVLYLTGGGPEPRLSVDYMPDESVEGRR